jgi:hypothetical protein
MLRVARIMLHNVGGWKSLPPQGNDRGTQYRSAIVVYTPEHEELAECSLCSCVRIHMYGRSTRSHAFAPPLKCAHARRQACACMHAHAFMHKRGRTSAHAHVPACAHFTHESKVVQQSTRWRVGNVCATTRACARQAVAAVSPLEHTVSSAVTTTQSNPTAA